MKLSDAPIQSGNVIRDGEFKTLGNVNQFKPHQLSFIDDAAYLPYLISSSNISCIIAKTDLLPHISSDVGIVESDNPRKCFYLLHNHLADRTDFYSEPFESVISKQAAVHPRAYVAENNVRIEEGCVVGPNSTIHENSVLKKGVIVRGGSVIGTEGFRFERFGKEILPVRHVGGVLLDRGVEIQANTCVASAKFGGDCTIVGEETKIDNLVHIAHNAVIGKRCLIAACAIVAGSATVGDDVWIGPNACISNGLTVGDGAFITMGSVVTRNVSAGQKVTGNFAIDHELFIDFIKGLSCQVKRE